MSCSPTPSHSFNHSRRNLTSLLAINRIINVVISWVYCVLVEVFNDHRVMKCIGNRVTLNVFRTTLTLFYGLWKSWFYQLKLLKYAKSDILVANGVLQCPEIYQQVACSVPCAIPSAMFNKEHRIMFMNCINIYQNNKVRYHDYVLQRKIPFIQVTWQ